ncbi:MAG: hypothetical protein Q7J29_07820 [Stagnimonas sp.]|nr:hypothetical protein [Stagnimonas sp.]
MKLRLVWGFLGCALWSAMLIGAPGRAEAEVDSGIASCRLGCDQALAVCERKLGPSGKCPQRRSACSDQCAKSGQGDLRQTPKKKPDLCIQRCDLNRSSCESANPPDVDYCAAGQKSCMQRCN